MRNRDFDAIDLRGAQTVWPLLGELIELPRQSIRIGTIRM